MINKELIYRKLVKLTEYLDELRPLTEYSFEQYQSNSLVKRTTERLVMLTVEVASDINAHLIAKITKKPSSSYFDSFIQLGELKIISVEFAREIAQSAGLRNRLIHEYEEIDDSVVYNSISVALISFQKYIHAIQDFINTLDKKSNHANPNTLPLL